MFIKLGLQILIGLVGYSVWALMAYYDPSQRPDFLKFNIMMAVGTIGLVLREMQNHSNENTKPPSNVNTPTTPISTRVEDPNERGDIIIP